jgi:type II secretory pathway pseudopilin PulG
MTRRTIEIAAFLAAVLVAALAFNAWLASHDEQQRLQSTLAAQKQIIAAADARERARDAALSQTLAQIEKLKRTSQTPEQIVRDLPNYLPLPQPITLVRNSPTNSSEESSHDSWQSPANPGNSIAPGVAASASATSPGTLSLPGSAAGADIKLADQPRCKKASEFRNAQSICQADKNTVPEVLRPNLGPESALEAPAKKSVVDESGARTSLDAARASAKNSATSNAIQAASPNSPSEPATTSRTAARAKPN